MDLHKTRQGGVKYEPIIRNGQYNFLSSGKL